VAHAAQFRTLAKIDARFIDVDDLFVDTARYGVKLEPE
jgi:hypothetical protein